MFNGGNGFSQKDGGVHVPAVLFFLLGLGTGVFLQRVSHHFIHSPNYTVSSEQTASNDTEPSSSSVPKPSYPFFLMPFLTGIVFVLTYLNTDAYPQRFKFLGFFALLLVISFIDLKIHIIPNPLVLAFLTWGLLWQAVQPTINWSQAFFGLLLGGGFLLLAAIISRGGMGGGDIKLMAAAGFALGLPLTGLALFVGSLIGAAAGIILLALGLKKRKDPIPFGPFLSLGIYIAMLWGPQYMDVYLEAAAYLLI